MQRWKRWLLICDESLGKGWRWLRTAPNVEGGAIVLAVIAVLVCQALGFHEHQMPWLPSSGDEVPRDWIQPDWWTLFYNYLAPYLKLIALLGGIIFHLAILRAQPDTRRLLLPTWIACSLLAAWLVADDAYDEWQWVRNVMIGKPFSTWAYATKLLLLAIAALMPAAALTWYQRSPVWERYVLRTIAQPLVFCLAAFCSLWVLVDLLDNLRDFQESGVKPARMIAFYGSMLPFVFVESATPALLLAVLHALLRLVKSNEMVSLQSAGLSTMRVLRPFWMTAAIVATISMALNYDWAQRAEGERAALLNNENSNRRLATLATSVMHYHAATRRLWFVSQVPFDLRHEKLRGVEVRQFDEHGKLQESWSAATAWRWANGMWSFSRGIHNRYEADGTPTPVDLYHSRECPRLQYDAIGWPETLWDVINSTQSPELMGVPDLVATLAASAVADDRTQLNYRSQAWHRVVFPWQAFALVFIVSLLPPLHARQGLLRSVGIGIALYLGLMFLNSATLTIARGGHLPALLSLLMPVLLLIGAGIVLLLNRQHFRWPVPSTIRWRDAWRLLRGRRTWHIDAPGEFYRLNEPHIRS